MNTFLNARNKFNVERSKMIIRANILNNLKLEKAQISKDSLMLDEFFNISRHSDLDLLQNLVKDITPPEKYDNVYLKHLYKDQDKELILVWLQNKIPVESHDEHLESIFILEGSCDCYVDDLFIQLEKGGYIQIPLNVDHTIISTSSKPVKAIVSLVKV